MIDGQNFFEQLAKNYIRTYDNIQKITTGQRNDYATCFLLGCLYFKLDYKLIAIDLSKYQQLDVDPKGIQQISFGKLGDR